MGVFILYKYFIFYHHLKCKKTFGTPFLSIKFPCDYACLSYGDLLNFGKSFPYFELMSF